MMMLLVFLLAAPPPSPVHNLTQHRCKLGEQTCVHERLITHVSERYLDALKALCHVPPARHRACRMHRHLKVGDFRSTLSRQQPQELRAVENLLDVCHSLVQSALCSFVRTHPVFNLQGGGERARQNEANLLTEDCLDPCPAYEQERSRATHCLKPLVDMMETGVHFNTSAARQQWLEYSAERVFLVLLEPQKLWS